MLKKLLGAVILLSVLFGFAIFLCADEVFHGEPDSVTRPGERFKKPSIMISTDTLKLISKKANYEVNITSTTVLNALKPKIKKKSQSKSIKK